MYKSTTACIQNTQQSKAKYQHPISNFQHTTPSVTMPSPLYALEILSTFDPFAFTITGSRSTSEARRTPDSPPPKYTLVDDIPQSPRQPPQSCNCNICTGRTSRTPPRQSFSVPEQVEGAMYAAGIAAYTFTVMLESCLHYVSPGIFWFLTELFHEAFSHDIGFIAGCMVLACVYLSRAVAAFTVRLSGAIDNFGEELMPDMTSPPALEGFKLTRYLIRQDKMMRRSKMFSSPLWFEVGYKGPTYRPSVSYRETLLYKICMAARK